MIDRYLLTRNNSIKICSDLELEDYSVQPLEFVSPPKWHLGHSTWFFETFVLLNYDKNYKAYNDDFAFLFNSYYNNAGERVMRSSRGLLTRPSVEEVIKYREYVDNSIVNFLGKERGKDILDIIELGINHEEQHQELLFYDIKYILGNQVLFPQFKTEMSLLKLEKDNSFLKFPEGVYEIGFNSDGFCYDNELGFHKVYIHDFEISNSLVSNKEYIEFIEDGAYSNFNLWHDDAWTFINENNIKAPLYWYKKENGYYSYSFEGFKEVDLNLPVMNISYYEAFAFAQWKGMRLPTEFEWEVASDKLNWGQLWEHTSSAYLPYPGFEKAGGALGEYNGKFMVNQHVLRGASFATSLGHSRKTYRNFFHPNMRWMFSGIRLVK